ncbi:MAG: excinuclease ABC subunit UvrB [Candidatus Kaiserbacteria bacterium]|nr:excinuclease ABC subunit UvrB [Candidatus Kaiserbacteria bacterium]
MGDTPVLIRLGNEIKKENIGALIDQAIESRAFVCVRNEDDTEILDSSDMGIETYSVCPQTGKTQWKRITQMVRHESPQELSLLTTSCGRSVTTTSDHNFFRAQKGKLELVRTEDLREGDLIPIPRALSGPNEPLGSVEVDTIFLSGSRRYYADTSHDIEMRDLVLSGLSYQKRYRVEHFDERVPLTDCASSLSREKLLTVSAGTKVSLGKIALRQFLTPRFLRFLGYYIAEGHAEKNYVILSSADSEIISDIRTEAELRGMSFHHRPDTYDYQCNGAGWTDILSSWMGTHSKSKHLPPFWPMLSDEQLAELLKAYFSADGGVDGVTVSATTVSHELASDILYALLRFGIVGRLGRRMMPVPNKTYRTETWRITISGRDYLRIFSERIGFVLTRKNEKLASVISETANTNVDLIPIDGHMLSKARFASNILQRDIALACGVNRSYISMLEDGKRLPSRLVVETLADFFRERNTTPEVHSLVSSLDSLLGLFWSPIKEIKKVKGEHFVYDFAVEENETFLAGQGGLFVHNTFTVANVIAEHDKPTLVMAHNKTLAAQLAQEYREFFPENAVHYFVSYYDYYQPEAYIAHSDTYIEKEAMINAEIDRLRHAATQALLTRKDVIIVASVSAIYGLGSPEQYQKVHVQIQKGSVEDRASLIRKLVGIYFERTNADLNPGQLRAIGNSLEFMPVNERAIYRITFEGETIAHINQLDPISRAKLAEPESVFVFPAKHFVTSEEERNRAIEDIKLELEEQLAKFKREAKPLEAERLKRRTMHDLALIRELGYTSGIENYSRHFDGRKPGEPPFTLLSYFPHKKDGSPDFLTVIDESHVTVPQIGGMYAGDKSRKDNLVEYGFRLPSARDNRPLRFEEFEKRVGQVLYTSATPGVYEREHSEQVVEQIIRPTGLIDPELTVRGIVEDGSYKGQIADFIQEAETVIARGGRALATTLTKQMAEDLSAFLRERGIKAEYLHSDVKTIDRIDILTNFRKGIFDILVGVNLLREGLDLPEVELVGILDADKEGFLRSETSLIQTIGRAARNVLGRVILYADNMTGSLDRAISETNRRRALQVAYNEKHGITPTTIKKEIRDIAASMRTEHQRTIDELLVLDTLAYADDPKEFIKRKREEMAEAVEQLDFETAALIRDELYKLEGNGPKAKKPRVRKALSGS